MSHYLDKIKNLAEEHYLYYKDFVLPFNAYNIIINNNSHDSGELLNYNFHHQKKTRHLLDKLQCNSPILTILASKSVSLLNKEVDEFKNLLKICQSELQKILVYDHDYNKSINDFIDKYQTLNQNKQYILKNCKPLVFLPITHDDLQNLINNQKLSIPGKGREASCMSFSQDMPSLDKEIVGYVAVDGFELLQKNIMFGDQHYDGRMFIKKDESKQNDIDFSNMNFKILMDKSDFDLYKIYIRRASRFRQNAEARLILENEIFRDINSLLEMNKNPFEVLSTFYEENFNKEPIRPIISDMSNKVVERSDENNKIVFYKIKYPNYKPLKENNLSKSDKKDHIEINIPESNFFKILGAFKIAYKNYIKMAQKDWQIKINPQSIVNIFKEEMINNSLNVYYENDGYSFKNLQADKERGLLNPSTLDFECLQNFSDYLKPIKTKQVEEFTSIDEYLNDDSIKLNPFIHHTFKDKIIRDRILYLRNVINRSIDEELNKYLCQCGNELNKGLTDYAQSLSELKHIDTSKTDIFSRNSQLLNNRQCLDSGSISKQLGKIFGSYHSETKKYIKGYADRAKYSIQNSKLSDPDALLKFIYHLNAIKGGAEADHYMPLNCIYNFEQGMNCAENLGALNSLENKLIGNVPPEKVNEAMGMVQNMEDFLYNNDNNQKWLRDMAYFKSLSYHAVESFHQCTNHNFLNLMFKAAPHLFSFMKYGCYNTYNGDLFNQVKYHKITSTFIPPEQRDSNNSLKIQQNNLKSMRFAYTYYISKYIQFKHQAFPINVEHSEGDLLHLLKNILDIENQEQKYQNDILFAFSESPHLISVKNQLNLISGKPVHTHDLTYVP